MRHTHVRTTVTWRRKTSAFAPGRLDWLFLSSDVLKLEKSFVIDSAEMSRKARKKAKLRKKDSLKLSDHLALVADLSFRTNG